MDILDNPIINQTLFYPRKAVRGEGSIRGFVDGTIPVDGAELGFRYYPSETAKAVMLYFHGNGEIAPDHDGFAKEYHRAGASLFVVDYRGYGWSTGKPTVGTLLPDAEAVLLALSGILQPRQPGGKALFVMGRSLGSSPAVHLAYKYTDQFKGLILESASANSKRIMLRLGLPVHLLKDAQDPMNNVEKLTTTDLPLLVIHGQRDNLIPIENGQALFDASPASDKQFLSIPRAGHNDLLFLAADRYFDAIAGFITRSV